jgi:hypothetical protein
MNEKVLTEQDSMKSSERPPLDKRALFARLTAVQYPMDQDPVPEEEEQDKLIRQAEA